MVVSRKLLRFDSVRQEIIVPKKLSEGDPTSSINTILIILSVLIWNVSKTIGVIINNGKTTDTQ